MVFQKVNAVMEKRYFSIKELANYTGLPRGTLYDWSSQGLIPSIKIGRRVLFDIVDIDQFLAELKRKPFSPEQRANEVIKEL